MSTIRKPGVRFLVPQWEQHNALQSEAAEGQRFSSHAHRQDSCALRIHTTKQTEEDERGTRHRLTDRIQDVSSWKQCLESTLRQVETESNALAKAKDWAEQFLTGLRVPREVVEECLVLRDGRRDGELLSDPVEDELRKEKELVGDAEKTLQLHINNAFQQLCRLQEIQHKLSHDVRGKTETLDIDTTCLSLTVNSPDISLKPDPLRIPPGCTTPEQWEHFSRSLVNLAQQELLRSVQMREELALLTAQLQNQLDTQHRMTDFALRKRIHNLEQACSELRWQCANNQREMSELLQDICALEEELSAKDGPLKLVHTRLENRTCRPGVDLCRDEVHYGLVAEAKQLEASISSLQQKLNQARHTLQMLQHQQTVMDEDLACKMEALSLDQRSLETRKRLQTQVRPIPFQVLNGV